MLTDRQRIEDAIIPALFRGLIYSHVRQSPEVAKTYDLALEVLQETIRNALSRNYKLLRRLDRICGKINKYFVQNAFNTQKGFLCVSAWLVALDKAGAITIHTPRFYQLLEDMGEIIQRGYKEIAGLDKVDASAMKHVNKLHQIAQAEGYFV